MKEVDMLTRMYIHEMGKKVASCCANKGSLMPGREDGHENEDRRGVGSGTCFDLILFDLQIESFGRNPENLGRFDPVEVIMLQYFLDMNFFQLFE